MNSGEHLSQLLTIPMFAALVALKPATIRKKILQREIATVKIGKAVRIPADEAARLIRQGYRPARLEAPEEIEPR